MSKGKAKDMKDKKMFGAPLTLEQIAWIKQAASKSKSSASEVLRQVVDMARVYNPREFEDRIVKEQLKRRHEEVSRQFESLSKEREELEAQLNG